MKLFEEVEDGRNVQFPEFRPGIAVQNLFLQRIEGSRSLLKLKHAPGILLGCYGKILVDSLLADTNDLPYFRGRDAFFLEFLNVSIHTMGNQFFVSFAEGGKHLTAKEIFFGPPGNSAFRETRKFSLPFTKADQGSRKALAGDCKNPLNLCGMGWRFEGCVTKERMNE